MCWEQGLCNGVLIGETGDVDSNTCLELCKSNEECRWFTHDSSDSVCLMFQGCQSIDSACTTCLSSQRQCSPRDDDQTGTYIPGFNETFLCTQLHAV